MPALHGRLGLMLERQRRYREAVAAYTRAARLDTAGARWRARLGGVLERQGRFGDAEAALLEALRREPDRLDAHLILAMIYRRQGKWEDEARVYERAIGLKPGDAHLHADLGLALEAQGLLGPAEGQFRRAGFATFRGRGGWRAEGRTGNDAVIATGICRNDVHSRRIHENIGSVIREGGYR